MSIFYPGPRIPRYRVAFKLYVPFHDMVEANVHSSDKASCTPQARRGRFGIELDHACVANSRHNVCGMAKELFIDKNGVLISWENG